MFIHTSDQLVEYGVSSAFEGRLGGGDGRFVGLGLGSEVGAMYFAAVPVTLITASESEKDELIRRILAAGSHARP